MNPLSVGSLANIFFHSDNSFFNGFLCCAKTFKFNLVLFVYFCFYFHYSRRWIKNHFTKRKKYCCNLCQTVSVLPRFSSEGFIESGFTFRSLIHFEFIFVYGVRECSTFIILHVTVQFSRHHLLKRLSFLVC